MPSTMQSRSKTPGNPDRWLVIGPDRAGNLLEVVGITTVEGTQLAIHAMRMRGKFRRLLDP